ncbi:MAG: glycosyltransferase [Myxococcota bacterium]
MHRSAPRPSTGSRAPRRDRVEGRPYVLHVGSDLPRKRIDVLLRAFAVLRRKRPELCLAQRGARPREAQAALVRELGLEDAIVDLPRLRRDELAAHYRGARAVLLSSDAEGFGLPVIEALACGAPVACTDIPAFREVGGPVVHRAPAGEPEALARAALDALATVDDVEVRAARSAWAARTSWEAHAARIARAYGELLGRRP